MSKHRVSCRLARACDAFVSIVAILGAGAAVAARPVLPDGFISGKVASSRGPEAGVWVIAETTELKTPFVKIVVTDDEGRYVLPQLPEATSAPVRRSVPPASVSTPPLSRSTPRLTLERVVVAV